MRWLQLKLDTEYILLVLEILSYFKALSTFHPKFYFHQRSWHHLGEPNHCYLSQGCLPVKLLL